MFRPQTPGSLLEKVHFWKKDWAVWKILSTSPHQFLAPFCMVTLIAVGSTSGDHVEHGETQGHPLLSVRVAGEGHPPGLR